MKIKVITPLRGNEFMTMTVGDFKLHTDSADISMIQLWSDRIMKSFPLSVSIDGVLYDFVRQELNQGSFGVASYQRSSDYDNRKITTVEISELILKYVGKEVNQQNRNSIHYMLSALRSIE